MTTDSAMASLGMIGWELACSIPTSVAARGALQHELRPQREAMIGGRRLVLAEQAVEGRARDRIEVVGPRLKPQSAFGQPTPDRHAEALFLALQHPVRQQALHRGPEHELGLAVAQLEPARDPARQ